jgi:hypothetical protein
MFLIKLIRNVCGIIKKKCNASIRRKLYFQLNELKNALLANICNYTEVFANFYFLQYINPDIIIKL